MKIKQIVAARSDNPRDKKHVAFFCSFANADDRDVFAKTFPDAIRGVVTKPKYNVDLAITIEDTSLFITGDGYPVISGNDSASGVRVKIKKFIEEWAERGRVIKEPQHEKPSTAVVIKSDAKPQRDKEFRALFRMRDVSREKIQTTIERIGQGVFVNTQVPEKPIQNTNPKILGGHNYFSFESPLSESIVSVKSNDDIAKDLRRKFNMALGDGNQLSPQNSFLSVTEVSKETPPEKPKWVERVRSDKPKVLEVKDTPAPKAQLAIKQKPPKLSPEQKHLRVEKALAERLITSFFDKPVWQKPAKHMCKGNFYEREETIEGRNQLMHFLTLTGGDEHLHKEIAKEIVSHHLGVLAPVGDDPHRSKLKSSVFIITQEFSAIIGLQLQNSNKILTQENPDGTITKTIGGPLSRADKRRIALENSMDAIARRLGVNSLAYNYKKDPADVQLIKQVAEATDKQRNHMLELTEISQESRTKMMILRRAVNYPEIVKKTRSGEIMDTDFLLPKSQFQAKYGLPKSESSHADNLAAERSSQESGRDRS